MAGIVVFYDSDNKVESVKFRSAFEATILEIHNSYYLVEPAEGSQECKASERIEVPMQSLDPSLEPEVGDTIEIMHSGVIMEINPPRLREVYSIKVVHEAKKEDSNNETENKVEATTEAEVIETAVVYPLPTTIDLDNIEDCTLAVSIENGNIYSNEAGTATLKMRVTVYDYELYDMVDISQLEVGNILEINKAQVELVSIETNELGTVIINGGLDVGGYELVTNENGVYYSVGYSDIKTYHEIGEIELAMSPEFVYIDASDPDGGEKKYTVADFKINYVFLYYNGTQHNK